MEQTGSKKKRARTSSSPDDDKRRGRPRVEKQDESAADRRRTQIRMAQRAYRQRKESTLEELRKRVSDLTNSIELMNKAFLDCRDRLYASNLPEDQLIDLHEVSLQFETFVKDARNPSEEDDTLPAKDSHRTSIGSKNDSSQAELVTEPRHEPSWLDESVVAAANRQVSNGRLDVGMGYRMYAPESEDTSQSMDYVNGDTNPKSQELVPSHQFDNLFQQDDFDILRAEVPDSLQLTGQLSPILTYSFQETTFGRRVHRACAEAAYQLLLDPTRRPAEFERIFRLSLMGRDRAKMIAAMKTVLNRGPHEELDFWEAPLIHVGGAGTHYARRDPYGNILPMKETHNLGIIGPQTLALLENASRDNISTDMTVEIAGFEGEWFDPYDVQGYLEEKGIYIDPTASFAEAELVEYPATPGSPSSSSSPLTIAQIRRLQEEEADLSKWNEYANVELGAVGYSDAQYGGWMNFLEPGESIKPFDASVARTQQAVLDLPMSNSNSLPTSPQPRKKHIVVDISKFVKVLTTSGVCLGRTPGFKRRDVDRALVISSFDAF